MVSSIASIVDSGNYLWMVLSDGDTFRLAVVGIHDLPTGAQRVETRELGDPARIHPLPGNPDAIVVTGMEYPLTISEIDTRLEMVDRFTSGILPWICWRRLDTGARGASVAQPPPLRRTGGLVLLL